MVDWYTYMLFRFRRVWTTSGPSGLSKAKKCALQYERALKGLCVHVIYFKEPLSTPGQDHSRYYYCNLLPFSGSVWKLSTMTQIKWMNQTTPLNYTKQISWHLYGVHAKWPCEAKEATANLSPNMLRQLQKAASNCSMPELCKAGQLLPRMAHNPCNFLPIWTLWQACMTKLSGESASESSSAKVGGIHHPHYAHYLHHASLMCCGDIRKRPGRPNEPDGPPPHFPGILPDTGAKTWYFVGWAGGFRLM